MLGQPLQIHPTPTTEQFRVLFSPWISVSWGAVIRNTLLVSQHTLNACISKPSQTCFCALSKHTVIAGIKQPVIQGARCQFPVCINLSGLCLNTGCCKVCYKAHLDKLSERVHRLSVSLQMSAVGFIFPHFFPWEPRHSGSYELHGRSCSTQLAEP